MKIIIIEGVDGTGKSTFAKLLQQALDGPILKFPPALPKPSDLSDPLTEALFYINGMSSCPYLRQSEEDRLFTPYSNNEVLICDRSFITTMVYQGYEEESTERSFLFPSIFQLGSAAFFSRIPNPFEVTFLRLHCELEESLKRMDSRNSGKEDTELDRVDRLSIPEKRAKLATLSDRFDDSFENLRQETQTLTHRFPTLKDLQVLNVDTTHSSPIEAANSVLPHLGLDLLQDDPPAEES